MRWIVALTSRAEKDLRKAASRDKARLDAVLSDPQSFFMGDVKPLKGRDGQRRKRVGSWRIFFILNEEVGAIMVLAIQRRSSNTY